MCCMILSYADAKLHKVTRKSSGKYESTKVEQIFLGELRCRMCQKRDKRTLEHKKMNIRNEERAEMIRNQNSQHPDGEVYIDCHPLNEKNYNYSILK